MNIVDSHFHYYPREVFEALSRRKSYPRAEPDGKGGYRYFRREGLLTINPWADWFDLSDQFAYMDRLGRGTIDVISTMGPFAIHHSDVSVEQGREDALQWNEIMAQTQRANPGRFWGTAAIPLTDTATAIDVLDHAILKLGLVGANLPGSVGSDPRIDAQRLEPFYARVEELDVPLFLHPTDAVFYEQFNEGYGGALHLSMGRVVEVSVGAARLIFSGIMERHPNLRIIMSHTGGALPYQAGRLDKNGKAAKLGRPPSYYLKQFYTDLVNPQSLGMEFALRFFGPGHVLYGTDYPCWMPADCLDYFDEIDVPADVQQKVFRTNARELWKLREPVAT